MKFSCKAAPPYRFFFLPLLCYFSFIVSSGACFIQMDSEKKIHQWNWKDFLFSSHSTLNQHTIWLIWKIFLFEKNTQFYKLNFIFISFTNFYSNYTLKNVRLLAACYLIKLNSHLKFRFGFFAIRVQKSFLNIRARWMMDKCIGGLDVVYMICNRTDSIGTQCTREEKKHIEKLPSRMRVSNAIFKEYLPSWDPHSIRRIGVVNTMFSTKIKSFFMLWKHS